MFGAPLLSSAVNSSPGKSAVEKDYSIVEKECLAVKWALDSLKYYLLGREFILETDHKDLQWLQRIKDTNSRITRWYLAMQPFRFLSNMSLAKKILLPIIFPIVPVTFPKGGSK